MNWYYSESMNRPSETDTTSSKVYNYVRRNIEEVTVDGETKYTWEECIPKKPKNTKLTEICIPSKCNLCWNIKEAYI